MPFAGYESFDQCVIDNEDKNNPDAYCAAIKQDAKGEEALSEAEREYAEDDPCWEGYTQVGMKTDENGNRVPNCVPDDDVPEQDRSLSGVTQFTPSLELSQSELGKIQRLEEGENTVRYTKVKLLGPGAWTDSGSGETILYSPKTMQNLEIRDDNAGNIMHDADNEVSQTGHIDNSEVIKDETGIYADIVIDTSNAAGQYADENMQKTLETNGAKGFGGPSVEIDAEGQEVEFNQSRGLKELVKGYISGFGLVKNPAAKNTAFARQTAQRGVALSAPKGQTHYHLEQEGISMANIEEVRETLDSAGLGDTIDDMTDEEVMDMAQNLHSDLMSDLEDDESADGDTEMGDYEDDEEDDEDEEDTEMADDDMAEELQALRQRLEVLEDEMQSMSAMSQEEGEELSDELETAKEELAEASTVAELSESLEAVQTELSEVKTTTKELSEQPTKPRSLSGSGNESDSEPTGRVTEITDPSPY